MVNEHHDKFGDHKNCGNKDVFNLSRNLTIKLKDHVTL